jgi:hypothetical protein
MKVFEDEDEKVNFADKNNVLLGYDMRQQCCESAKWLFSLTIGGEKIRRPDLEDYVFDPEFSILKEWTNYIEEVNQAIFRIVNGDREVFLTLSNAHKGYYSHGFELEVGGQVIRKGNL